MQQVGGRLRMLAINPYQSPEERFSRDDRVAPDGDRKWGILRLMIGVWSPFSLSTAARRASTKAALVASTATCCLYFGIPLGVIGGCAAEPFRGWADFLVDISLSAAVMSAFFISPCLLVVLPLLLVWRARRIDEHYFRLLLIGPLAFRLPYSLLCTALFLEIVREPSFEFTEIQKPFFISYEYAARFANAGVALGSIFAVLMIALPIKRQISRQSAMRRFGRP